MCIQGLWVIDFFIGFTKAGFTKAVQAGVPGTEAEITTSQSVEHREVQATPDKQPLIDRDCKGYRVVKRSAKKQLAKKHTVVSESELISLADEKYLRSLDPAQPALELSDDEDSSSEPNAPNPKSTGDVVTTSQSVESTTKLGGM